MGPYGYQSFWPHLITFLVSFSLSAAIAVAGWCGGLRAISPDTERAVQSSHVGRVPRLGGIGVIFGTTLAAAAFFPDQFWRGHLYIIVCAFPALALAILEDVGRQTRPSLRLAVTFAAAACYMVATEEYLPRTNVAVIDDLLAHPMFAMALSTVLVSAAVQAMNLIDGLNGLCSGIAFLICVSLAYIAEADGNKPLFYLATTSAVALLGFFVVNYPSGGLFLGDTGAYWVGFSLSLMSIHFLRQMESLAAPAMLLLFFWPAYDLFVTVCRRLISRRHLFTPDRLHPHQIAVRFVRRRLSGPQRRRAANPIASFVIIVVALPPMFLGALFWNRPGVAWIALGVCILVYGLGYVWVLSSTNGGATLRLKNRCRPSELNRSVIGLPYGSSRVGPTTDRSGSTGPKAPSFIKDGL